MVTHEGCHKWDIIIRGDRIAMITEPGAWRHESGDVVIDATGCHILPGVIDEHVHFREPGLTAKADFDSESRAAAYGGVTTVFDMPNTSPQTTTLRSWEEKMAIAASKCHVNYSCFIGATNDNASDLMSADYHRIPGIKLFMGSSTGNMLVDRIDALDRVFQVAHDKRVPVMTHCEDTSLINANMAKARQMWGDDPEVIHHPWIRSEEACVRSTALAIKMAEKHECHLHVAHISTAREVEMVDHCAFATSEAAIPHLLFTDADYALVGTRMKCNPAVKTMHDMEALRRAMAKGKISTVATDHAPHLLSDKEGGCVRAASGMPMVQFSLIALLGLVDAGVLTMERVVDLTSLMPKGIFKIRDRGVIRIGYKADLAIVRHTEPWVVTDDIVQSKCRWTPLAGRRMTWKVEHTICNGVHVFDNGRFNAQYIGEEVMFR